MHSLASLDVSNSAAVHPDAEKTTFRNLRCAQIELMASKWRRISYDEWVIAGGVLERLVNPTGEIFDRDRGAGTLNLPGFAPFKGNLIEPSANAADATGSPRT